MAKKSAAALAAEAEEAKAARVRQCILFMKYDPEELGEDEVSLIIDLFDAATAYLARAGVTPESAGGQFYTLLYRMVLHDYDHRDPDGNVPPYPQGVHNAITQLKCCNFQY